MIVWTAGTYGHVALVTSVQPGEIDVLEQNVAGDGHFTIPYDGGAAVTTRWGWPNPAGWAHAKANTGEWSDAGEPVDAGVDAGAPCADAGPAGQCVTDVTNWSCSQSAWNGAQYWTCSSGSLYRCLGTQAVKVTCASGCVVHALGTDDACK